MNDEHRSPLDFRERGKRLFHFIPHIHRGSHIPFYIPISFRGSAGAPTAVADGGAEGLEVQRALELMSKKIDLPRYIYIEMYMYVYMYLHTYIYIHTHLYIYIFI